MNKKRLNSIGLATTGFLIIVLAVIFLPKSCIKNSGYSLCISKPHFLASESYDGERYFLGLFARESDAPNYVAAIGSLLSIFSSRGISVFSFNEEFEEKRRIILSKDYSEIDCKTQNVNVSNSSCFERDDGKSIVVLLNGLMIYSDIGSVEGILSISQQ